MLKTPDANELRALPRWELYRVLAEPVRLRLLALTAEEELAVGELAELLGESQPNVSRHATSLKQAGVLAVRKQGTRTLLRFVGGDDPVVLDALASGRALAGADGSLQRVAEVIRAREAVTREFFEQAPGADDIGGPASELGAYLQALSPLLPRRRLAVDAGTGDGRLLDVLAPVFDEVVACDRSAAQLLRARARLLRRGYQNVQLVHGDLDNPDVRAAVGGGADAVFAVRMLHHAAKPARALAELHALCAPGGALLAIDYAHHADEAMREQADLWLGFDPEELCKLARAAGFQSASAQRIPSALCGDGPDRHLPWLLLCARRGESAESPESEGPTEQTTESAPALPRRRKKQ